MRTKGVQDAKPVKIGDIARIIRAKVTKKNYIKVNDQILIYKVAQLVPDTEFA
jgi:hypothetical protein